VTRLSKTLAGGVLAALAWAGSAAAQVAEPISDGPSLAPGEVFFETNIENVRMTISSDRAAVPIVDQFTVIISVEAPPWFLVSFPRIVDEFGPFNVLKQQKAGPFTTNVDGKRIERNERRYVLDPKDPGEHSIPPLIVSVLDGSKVPSIACVYLEECRDERTADNWVAPTHFLRTKRMPIEVTSVLPPDADIGAPKDIMPPVDLPPPPPKEIPWQTIGMGAAGALLLAAIVLLARRLSGREPRAKPVPMRPAHELALAALKRLESMRVEAPEQVDAFYVRLSVILRRYLDWRFDVRAPERTTEEILAAAQSGDGPIAGRRDLLGAFLAACDRVKFGRARPAGEDRGDMLGTARRFVEETADAGVRVPEARAVEVA